MLSTDGVTILQSRDIRSSPIRASLLRSLHAGNYASPTRSMPVETVSNIFDFAFHSSHDPASQSIAISHVCRQWRQISLSMPSLWTSISLSLPLTKSQLTCANVWTMRSRNRPLKIYMDFRDPSWDWDEAFHIFDCKVMDNIMHLLVPHASRWQSIELLTDTWGPIFAFLSYTKTINVAPLLQTIRLGRCNEYFVMPGEVFRPESLALPIAWFRGGSSFSHLRHVSLSGVHIDWTRSGLTDLRVLELRYHALDVMPTLPEFGRMLRANTALERLVILGWGPQIDLAEDKHLQTINLPELKEFEFGFVDVTYAIKLLSLFSFPGLRVFSVEDVASGIQLCEPQDCSRLFDCLVGMSAVKLVSPCILLSSLRELSLRSIYADDSSIRSLFGHLCAVTSLCLDRVNVTPLSAIFSVLHGCDCLQTLTLKDIDSAAAGFVLSSYSLPPRLRIFLDIEDEGEDVDFRSIAPAMDSL